MSSAALPPSPPLVAQPTERESYIDQRIRHTRRQVKTVDIIVGLATLAIGAIVYLLLAALADHWLVSGGLPGWTRWLLWLGLLGAVASFVFFRLLTPIIRPVNPVYAALTIESSQPTLRNSLINFLLLRNRKRELAAPIYQTIEQRAAADLTKVRAETAVDRAHLIRLFQILAAVLAVYCLYLVVSPKNPLNSAGRILFPWSNIEAMTRVSIDDVRPGDTRAFHGEFLAVSARITGLADDETPVLIYSTADGQTVGQAIPMAVPEGERRYQCTLPPGKTGLQQNYVYHITAGDCRTRRYSVEVRSAPAVVVERVEYDYPGYTGLADRTDDAGGDLRAIEGTKVTVHAAANAEIKPNTAEIDLGCSGRRGLPMSIDGMKATGQFQLKLNPEDENSPLYDSYQLRFADAEGRMNPHPVRHRIEVIRDLPPDVRVIEPKETDVRVAENGKITIGVEAKDPDFALRRVEIRAVRDDGRSLSIAPLLDKRLPAEPVAGEFQGSFSFEPAKYGLRAGDRVQYWAAAEDNKEPAANRTETKSETRWIVVDAPQSQKNQRKDEKNQRPEQQKDREQQPGDKSDQHQNNGQQQQQQQQDQQAGDQPSQDQTEGQQSQDGQKGQDQESQESGDGQPSDDNQSAEGKQGDRQKSDQGQGGEEENRRVDPETEAGDAFEEILNDQKQQQDKQPQDQSQPDGEKQPENEGQHQTNQNGQQRQDGAQQQNEGDNQSGEPQSNEEGSQNGNQRQEGEQSSAEEKGEQQSGPGLSGESKNQPGEPNQNDEGPSGDNSSGSKSSQDKGESKQSPDEKNTGEPSDGQPDGKTERSDDQKQPGEKTGRSKDDKKEPGDKSDDKSSDGGGKEGETGQQEQPDNKDGGKEDRPGGDKGTGKKDLPSDKPEETTDPGGHSPNEEKGKPDEQLRPAKPGDAPGERDERETPSPAKDTDESRAKGDTSGDREGEGEKGGGQQSNQEGLGGPGSNTPADQGASRTDELGQGETGSEAGDQQASKSPTGSDKKAATDGRAQGGEEQGKTTPDERSPVGKQSDSNEPPQPDQPQQSKDRSGIPTDQGGTSKDGVKGTAAGGQPGSKSGSPDSDGVPESGPDSANIDYARRQTELALEHLRDQLAKEKPELLDKLGWTKDDARRFLNRWEQMRRAAEQQGPEGDQAKRQFDEALKSLGLGRGTELKHGGVNADTPETQRDAGRSAPPPDWADHLRAYTRGVAGEEGKK